ncbi:MAG: helix-turn-helix domain-containing protein [Patescibacteria group bacterium]
MPFVQKQLMESGGFGHDLRELRELRGVSLERLGSITKIHPSIIQAFEDERLGDLVDPEYAERHVRSLVTVLEGRPAYFIKKYRELVEARGVLPNRATPQRRPRKRDFFVVPHALAFAGFLLIVLLMGGYLVWQGRVLQNSPSLVVTSPVDSAILDVPQVEIRGATDPSAIVTVNGRPAVVDRDGNFSLRFDVPRGSTTLTIQAQRRFGAPVTEIRRITYEHAAPDEIPTSVTATSTTSTRR